VAAITLSTNCETKSTRKCTLVRKFKGFSENTKDFRIRELTTPMPNVPPEDCEEYQKMVSGQRFYATSCMLKSTIRYVASDPVLVNGRLDAKRSCRALNDTVGDPQSLGPDGLAKARSEIIDSLFGQCHPDAVEVEPPFWCDYGYNIAVGKRFYCNYNCCILGSISGIYCTNFRLRQSYNWR
jgi:Maltose acetyltransferase